MTEEQSTGFPWGRLSIFILLLILLGVGLFLVIPREWLEQEYIDRVLQRSGIAAPLVYMLIKSLVIVVAVLPSAPLDVAAGAVFGPLLGSIYSLAANEIGAVVCFYIARALGRSAVTRLMRKDISFCDRCAGKHLAYLIFFARLEPIFSFALVSYGAGLTNISLTGFAISTFLGMTPATIALNYYGKSFLSGNIALQIALGLILVVLIFLIPIWIKRRNPMGLYDKLKTSGNSTPDEGGKK